MTKPPTKEEKAEHALRTARSAAHGFPDSQVRRCLDTQFTHQPPCYVVYADSEKAIVVYENDPDCLVAALNAKGRFVKLSDA